MPSTAGATTAATATAITVIPSTAAATTSQIIHCAAATETEATTSGLDNSSYCTQSRLKHGWICLRAVASESSAPEETENRVKEDEIVTDDDTTPDNKVHWANMGPTWVLSAPDGPHVGPMNLAIRDPSACYPCLTLIFL